EDLSRPLGALAALAEHGISIDLITLLPEMLAFTVKEEAVPQAANLLSTLGYEVQVSGPCAKVSIIGAGMRGRPGVMARVVKALHDAGTEILQTADSHTTISCLVWREKLQRAPAPLHDAFGVGGEGASGGGRAVVVAGTGTNDTRHSIHLTKEAGRAGADAFLLVNPYYNRPSQDGLYAHFVAIAESTGRPCMLYNIPGRTGVNCTPETIAR